MNAKIVITLEGQISIITQEGTFAAGKREIAGLLARLQANGLTVTLDGPVEQHRHDDGQPLAAHVHSH